MILALAMALDAILGEPKWLWSRLPHPAVLMGRLIGWADARFNQGTGRKAKGAGLVLGLVAGAGALGLLISQSVVLTVILAAVLLAQKSLVQHVAAVAVALDESVEAGRHAVAQIVGRDTAELDTSAVSRAAVESAAENFSDGVIAPIFWFAVAGLPGLLVYKVVNTADSMIGYLTEKHRDFGWAAARLDDGLNLIPARLTALLIAATHGVFAPLAIRFDASHHRSPNAGWPEAAMARVLGVALSGPRAYHGRMRDFPWVYAEGRLTAGQSDIRAAVRVLWRVWAVVFAGVVALSFA